MAAISWLNSRLVALVVTTFLLLSSTIPRTSSTVALDHVDNKPPPPAAFQSQATINSLLKQLISSEQQSSNQQQANATSPAREKASDSNVSTTTPTTFLHGILPIEALADLEMTAMPQTGQINDPETISRFMDGYNAGTRWVQYASTEAAWNYLTNITEHNREVVNEASDLEVNFTKKAADVARRINLDLVTDPVLKRVINKATAKGIYALPKDELEELKTNQRRINVIFFSTPVCEPGRPPPCSLFHTPELVSIMAGSTDYGQLYHLWTAWNNLIGPAIKQYYMNIVQMTNRAAVLNGLDNGADIWYTKYEVPGVESFKVIYEDVKPLYMQLYTFVRRRLHTRYPSHVPLNGMIPAHLFGELAGKDWSNLYESTKPFIDELAMEYSVRQEKDWSVEKIYRKAERFFQSLGFEALPDDFWVNSILTAPSDRDSSCIPASFDFQDGNDFRLKVCSGMRVDDVIVAHRELTSIYYLHSYRNLSVLYRDATNPAFSSAISESIALIASVPNYLQSIGITIDEINERKMINLLYNTALRIVPFIPYALLTDVWREMIFRQQLDENKLNDMWWDLRKEYQGIASPVTRSATDFDAGADYEIAHNMPYLGNLISYIVQFQFLKGLCNAAGYQGPLHKCRIDNSTEAGSKLRAMMEVGSKYEWPYVMKIMSGTEEISARGLMEYFQPLHDWLAQENSKAGEYVGWDSDYEVYSGNISYKPMEDEERAGSWTNDKTQGLFGNGVLPGHDCSEGQQCLEDSVCNGTVCVCSSGYVLWYEHCFPAGAVFDQFDTDDGSPQINFFEGRRLNETELAGETARPDANLNHSSHPVGHVICYSLLIFGYVYHRIMLY